MDKMDSSTFESSSHSDSTKTNGSGAESVGEAKKEEDFTKDNAASPIDLECHIQAERIAKLLDEALMKSKLALCLPELVRQYRDLGTSVSSQHLDDVLFIFEQYENPLFSTSLLNMTALEDIQAGDVSLKNRLNPELGHMIYILNSYPSLVPKVESIVQEMMKAHSQGYPWGKEAPAGLFYVLELESLREQMVSQMEITAADELRAKFKTRKLEQSNESLEEQIAEISALIEEEEMVFKRDMEQKEEVIKNYEMELQLYSDQSRYKLQKKILDSDRQMVLASRTHVVKDEMLLEEEVDVTNTYHVVLKDHLHNEKNLRARRIKVETQLSSWLQKYDYEMKEKQVDLEELTKQYEDEVEIHGQLEIKLAEQNKEFEPLMAEREEEYHGEMAEKLKKFLEEHAARVIQVAWRDVVANRAEKKKLKKMLKKIQERKEAEERAAELAAKKAAAAAKKAEKEAIRAEKEAKKAEQLAKKLEAAEAKKAAK